MKAVIDAGAFLAIEKRDRRVGAMLRVLQAHRVPLWTSAAVVAQVWRNGRKQALLAKMLAGVGVRALGDGDAKAIGELLALAHRNDVVDAHVAVAVDDGDYVFTSDPDDIARLLALRQIEAAVTRT